MKKKKIKQKILYAKYLEEHKEELEKKQIEEKLQEPVIVKKMTSGAKLLQVLYDGTVMLLKISGVGIVLILLSLAVTVLVNAPLREYVFRYFGIG